MKTSVEYVNLDWLLDSESSSSTITDTHQDIGTAAIPMPKNIGTGTYEAWILSIGTTIYRANYNFNQDVGGQIIPTANVTASFNEPTLMVHSLKKGRVIHQDELATNHLIFGEGIDLFRYAESISVTPMVDTSENIEMTSLMIGQSFLNALIGKPLAEQLVLNLGVLPMPKVVVKPIPSYVNHSLQECLKAEYTPQLKKVWAQAKSLEYISELATHICRSQSRSGTTEKQTRKLIKTLHQYLVNLDGKLPTIDSLAQIFGRSGRALNEDFQAEYGESIFSFVLNHRLNTAHVAIKNTLVPLKQISMRLGYAHVNHFSAAFKKKFGYSPGKLRK
jgi:AraC-like DNA-binding protein